MNFQVDVVTLGAIMALLVAISGWMFNTRKTNMAEGRHLMQIEALDKLVAELRGDVNTIQKCYDNTNGAIIEIKTNLEWLKHALQEIKDSLVEWKR